MDKEKLWFNDINVLIDTNNIFEIIPNEDMSFNKKINVLTRFSLYLSLLLYLLTMKQTYFYLPIIVISLSYILNLFYTKEKFDITPFDDNEHNEHEHTNCKKPSEENPNMNLLMSDNFSKNQESCKIDKKTNEKIDSIISNKILGNTNIFNNPLFNRTFYTMPNNKVPNDQVAFAKWLYDTPYSCKNVDKLCNPF